MGVQLPAGGWQRGSQAVGRWRLQELFPQIRVDGVVLSGTRSVLIDDYPRPLRFLVAWVSVRWAEWTLIRSHSEQCVCDLPDSRTPHPSMCRERTAATKWIGWCNAYIREHDLLALPIPMPISAACSIQRDARFERDWASDLGRTQLSKWGDCCVPTDSLVNFQNIRDH